MSHPACARHGAVAALLRVTAVGGALLVSLAGCQTAPRPIFPEVQPPRVWPPPPDTPRIRYIGALHGEQDLDIRPTGWDAFKEVLSGPRPVVAFSRPTAVAVHGECVFVADAGLGVVHLLNLNQRRYAALRGNPQDPLNMPLDLAIGGNQLVVVDRTRATVDVFDLAGQWRATHKWPELAAPVAITFSADTQTWWLADAAAHACFETRDFAALTRRLGERGLERGQFNFPTALAWRADVGLVVVDAMNFRVQIFDAGLAAVTAFGMKGDAAGYFARPRSAALDSEGHIYVLDNQFENIQIFNPRGQLLMAWGHEGTGPGEFAVPAGMTIDTRDRIWIADSYNARVQVFQYLAEAAPAATPGAADHDRTPAKSEQAS